MNELKVTVRSPEELENAAIQLLSFAGNSRIFAFSGAMGSGKTTFIKAICLRLGVRNSMNSPTFALMNEYSGIAGEPVYHFDFYRIKTEREAVDIGCGEYFYSGHYCLVEWPEKILNLLPKEIVHITIEVPGSGDETRLITFQHE
jgi:tRNA threonylcarbamoyladenosine biosynthesis protein TsaE